MKKHTVNNKDDQGFTIIEAIIVLAVVAFIIGVGIYGYHTRHKAIPAAIITTPTAPVQPGTSESIDQITNNEASSENNAYSSYDSQVQQSVASDNSALNNLGGAYNESNI